LYFDGNNWYADSNCIVVSTPQKIEEPEKEDTEEELKEDVLPPPDEEPPEIYDIRVVNIGVDTATIRWSTNEPTVSQLRWGMNSKALDFVELDPEFIISHKIVLSGLETGTEYYFKIVSKDKESNQSISSIQNFSTQGLIVGILTADSEPAFGDSSVLVMGTSEQTLGSWKLSADSLEDITVTQMIVYNKNPQSSDSIRNLKLYCENEQFGGSADKLSSDKAVFRGTCRITKGSYKRFSLRGNIVSWEDGAKAGEYTQFYIKVPGSITGDESDSIIASTDFGYSSTLGVGDKITKKLYLFRTNISLTSFCHGDCVTLRKRAVNDKIADVILNSVSNIEALFRSITFSVTGDINQNSADGAMFYLKTQDGTIKASGAFDINSGKVILLPVSDFYISNNPVIYEVVTNTFFLLSDDIVHEDNLGLSSSFGSPTIEGDFSWNDQAALFDIKWVDGVVPFSININYY
jgi:hypothetical protein